MIQTRRIFLRRIELSDIVDIYEYAKKSSVAFKAGWEPHKDINDTKTFIEWIKNTNADVFGIILKKNNKLIGTIGLHKRITSINGKNIEMDELGYVLNDKYWNLGIMTETVKEFLEYVFLIKKIKTLYCGHKLSNIASKRIIIKNGFEFSHFHTVPKLSDNESGLLKMYILKEKTYEKGI